MSKLFLFVLFLATTRLGASVLTDTVAPLEIGKRLHWLFSPTIRTENVGKWRSGANQVFFRTPDQPDFKPIGFLGRRIKPYLTVDPVANLEFRQFQRARGWGLTCWVAAMGVATYTVIQSIDWLLANTFGSDTIRHSLLGFTIGLASTIGLTIATNAFYVKSDRHLLKAVNQRNGLSGNAWPKSRIEATFGLMGNGYPGIRFQWRF